LSLFVGGQHLLLTQNSQPLTVQHEVEAADDILLRIKNLNLVSFTASTNSIKNKKAMAMFKVDLSTTEPQRGLMQVQKKQSGKMSK